ncbi:MAG: M56 family metallopeptidase [Bacteroidota bacterium]
MKAILFYLLQVIIASGILYGYYHFFLRNKKLHSYNRYFLLAATIVSICLPFLNVNIYFTSGQDIPAIYKVLQEVRVGTEKVAATGKFFSWRPILLVIYSAIATVLSARIIITIRKLFLVRKKYRAELKNNILFISTNEQNAPFSFFRWLFWNSDINPQSERGQKIMKHEIYHIQQNHSLDIVFIEFMSAIFWFNPFFLRIKKEIKTIHEFSADQYAMGPGNNYEYAELLLQQAFQTNQKLVNPFFNNQIKRRIAMITNPAKASYQYLRKMMILPVALIVTVLLITKCKSKDAYEKKETALEKVEVEATFPGGEAEWKKFLEQKLNANVPVDSGAADGQYTTLIQFIVDEHGNISDLKPLTKMGYGMEQEVVRTMKLSPNWVPARDHGVAVRSYRKQPITFVIQAE